MHLYLHLLGYGYTRREWYQDCPEVLELFHQSEYKIDKYLWKNLEKIENIKDDLYDYLVNKFSGKYIIGKEQIRDKTEGKRIRELIINNGLDIQNSEDYIEFLRNYNKETVFYKKLKLYCDIRDKFPNDSEILNRLDIDILDPSYKNYYNTFGTKELAALRFSKLKIEQKFKETTINVNIQTDLKEEIYKKFKPNTSYTLKNIKENLKKIYADLFLTKKPTAEQLKQFFENVKPVTMFVPNKTYGFNLGSRKYSDELVEKYKDYAVSSKSQNESLKKIIFNEFKVGQRYSLKHIKSVLMQVYLLLNISRAAKACDLGEYFDVKAMTIYDPNKTNGYEILGIKQ